MPDYGSIEYWDNRYSDDSEPFDWLFGFQELEPIIGQLLSKDQEILVIGCGNAPFSSDMFNAGYKGIWNTDLSSVVIQTQKRVYPKMKWDVMDALETGLEDNSIEAIIDKSLIDTLMCATGGNMLLERMMKEMHRVMEVGGTFITLSLHGKEEIIKAKVFEKDKLHWQTDYFRLKCGRWNATKDRHTSVAHTVIVCKKIAPGRVSPTTPLTLSGTLTEEEEAFLRRKQKMAVQAFATEMATIDELTTALALALEADMDIEGERTKSMADDSEDEYEYDDDDSDVDYDDSESSSLDV